MPDPLAEVREHHVLPSDLLAMARQNNPDLTITLDYRSGDAASPLVLRINSGRGHLDYERGASEAWYDVFSRAGLLTR